VKLLLTSGGVTNASIAAALLDLLGKPTAGVEVDWPARAVGAAQHR
jgi:hypothetical protein